MAFMDQFRFGGQNDLLQMPSQNTQFGMMQSPFGQQQPMQQRGFGMFQSPWQQNGGGYNPQPGNMGYNPQQPENPPRMLKPWDTVGHNDPVPTGGYRPIGNGTPGTTTQQFLQNQMNQQGGQPRDGNEANLWKYLSTHKDPTGPSGNGPTPGRPGRDQFGMPIGYADPILPWGFGGG